MNTLNTYTMVNKNNGNGMFGILELIINPLRPTVSYTTYTTVSMMLLSVKGE